MDHRGGHLLAIRPEKDGCTENRNQPILPPRQTIAWMAGYLQYELPVAAFMQQASCPGPFHRQAAENERAGRKSKILLFAFSVLANYSNRLGLAESPLRDHQLRAL